MNNKCTLLLYQNNRVFASISVVVNDLRAAPLRAYLRVQGAPSPSDDAHNVKFNSRPAKFLNRKAVLHCQTRCLTTTAGSEEDNKSTGEFVCLEG